MLTHEHFDHITGIERLRSRTNSKIICSKVCAERICDSKKNLSFYYGEPIEIKDID